MTGAGRASGANRSPRAIQRAADQVRGDLGALERRLTSSEADVRSRLTQLGARIDQIEKIIQDILAGEITGIDGGGP